MFVVFHLTFGDAVRMFAIRVFFMLLCYNHTLGLRKQLCYNDDECLINAVIDKVYPRLIAGMPGVETSDPLRIDAVVADLPTIRYTLNDASLTGLKDCQFVRLNNTRLEVLTYFDYAIECPVLTVSGEYELNGIIDSVPMEGKGNVKIIYKDYYISISGKHQRVKDDEGKDHVDILDYSVIAVLRGDVKHPEYSNLVFSNNDKCDNRIKLIEEITRETVMDVFMHKLIHNVKDFHHRVAIEDMHYKYVRS